MTFAPPTPPVAPNRTLRTVLLVIGSIALALVLVFTALGAIHSAVAAGGGPDDRGDGTRVLEGEVDAVRVDAAIADLTVRLADVDEPTVEWDSGTSGLRLRTDLVDGELVARVQDSGWGPFGWFFEERGGTARLEVLLPQRAEGVDLDLEATAGGVELDGDWGDVTIEATVGEVRLAGSAASLDLAATAGSTEGSGLEIDAVTIDATAGNVDLGFAVAPSSVVASTTAGELRLALPEGEYDFQTETALGDVALGLPSTPGAETVYRLTSTVGDIEITAAG